MIKNMEMMQMPYLVNASFGASVSSGELSAYLFIPGTFLFFSVPLEISDKTKPPWNFGKIMYVTSLRKAKNQDPWIFHMNFSCSLLEIPCCF